MPSGEPVIGIPFYLAHAALAQLEEELTTSRARAKIMMYFRHEAGHAFTYAYKLPQHSRVEALFGPFLRPYRDNYRPVPFSRDYVRHLPGGMRRSIPTKTLLKPSRSG